ncbi:MAG: hypothetical protein ABEJ31_09250 [Haloarculaceae archaeon]
MREIVDVSAPTDRRRLATVVYVVLSLALVFVAIQFTREVFGAGDPTVLGLDLAMGFALIGLMALAYYRLFLEHRLVLERDEDLW